MKSVKLAEVDMGKTVDGLTFDEYCDDPGRVREDAIADGVKGEPYKHYRSKKGLYTGEINIKYKDLDNGDLYEYAKRKYVKGEVL